MEGTPFSFIPDVDHAGTLNPALFTLIGEENFGGSPLLVSQEMCAQELAIDDSQYPSDFVAGSLLAEGAG